MGGLVFFSPIGPTRVKVMGRHSGIPRVTDDFCRTSFWGDVDYMFAVLISKCGCQMVGKIAQLSLMARPTLWLFKRKGDVETQRSDTATKVRVKAGLVQGNFVFMGRNCLFAFGPTASSAECGRGESVLLEETLVSSSHFV